MKIIQFFNLIHKFNISKRSFERKKKFGRIMKFIVQIVLMLLTIFLEFWAFRFSKDIISDGIGKSILKLILLILVAFLIIGMIYELLIVHIAHLTVCFQKSKSDELIYNKDNKTISTKFNKTLGVLYVLFLILFVAGIIIVCFFY